MAEAVKSALFVDYDSLQRSMNAGQGTRLADRAAAWIAALEAGQFMGAAAGRRKFAVRRCYAGGNVRGKQRDALAAAGFFVADTNAGDGGRGSADLQLAMDALDALAQPGGPDEFVFLVSGLELGPLLKRFKTAKRQVVVFSDAATPATDRAVADAMIDAGAFSAFVASDDAPAGDTISGGSAADRAEIEAFARKIHAATNIPLFSPKTFSELFRHLTEEIRQNGYHFQSTARNVAERLTAEGRNVTRRQVVFIVKGLALKGHVFSKDDSPDTLAEVFREQARYLITNAGIALDGRQEQLLSAWFVSRPTPAPAKRTAAPARPAPPAEVAQQQPASQPQAQAATQLKPAAAAPPAASQANGAQPPRPQPEKRPPPPQVVAPPAPPQVAAPAQVAPPPPPPAAAPPPVPAVKPIELPRSAAKPAPTPLRLSPSPAAREEAKAIIAARIAASAKLKPSKTAPGAKPAAKPGPAAKGAPPRRTGPDPQSEALESSILAAIAEAVDVLVDDGGGEDEIIVPEPQGRQRSETQRAQPPRKPSPEPDPEPEPVHEIEAEALPASEPEAEPQDGDGGDIGDQIQRIIASYNRNRPEDE